MSYVHIKYEYMRVEVPGFFAVMLLLARGWVVKVTRLFRFIDTTVVTYCN